MPSCSHLGPVSFVQSYINSPFYSLNSASSLNCLLTCAPAPLAKPLFPIHPTHPCPGVSPSSPPSHLKINLVLGVCVCLSVCVRVSLSEHRRPPRIEVFIQSPIAGILGCKRPRVDAKNQTQSAVRQYSLFTEPSLQPLMFPRHSALPVSGPSS